MVKKFPFDLKIIGRSFVDRCSMELYRLRPVLEVRKAELNTVVAPVYEIDRKRSEPVHKTSSLKEDKRLRLVL